MKTWIDIHREDIESFCRDRGSRLLAVFGSALSSDNPSETDIDILVEFLPRHTPGLLGMARMERELEAVLGGYKVDLRTPEDLSRYLRDSVIAEAVILYEA